MYSIPSASVSVGASNPFCSAVCFVFCPPQALTFHRAVQLNSIHLHVRLSKFAHSYSVQRKRRPSTRLCFNRTVVFSLKVVYTCKKYFLTTTQFTTRFYSKLRVQ